MGQDRRQRAGRSITAPARTLLRWLRDERAASLNDVDDRLHRLDDLLHVALFLATLLLVHNVAQTAQSLAEQICALHRGTRSQARARSQHVRSHRAGNEQARHGHAGWAGIPAPRARAMSRPRAKSRS